MAEVGGNDAGTSLSGRMQDGMLGWLASCLAGCWLAWLLLAVGFKCRGREHLLSESSMLTCQQASLHALYTHTSRAGEASLRQFQTDQNHMYCCHSHIMYLSFFVFLFLTLCSLDLSGCVCLLFSLSASCSLFASGYASFCCACLCPVVSLALS